MDGLESTNQLIKKHPFFSGLSNDQIDHLLNVSKKISLEAEEFLMREGDLDKQCYLIMEGTLEVVKVDEVNFGHRLASMGKGEVVGSIVLLDHKPRSASVRAMTDCQLLAISEADLEKLIAQDSGYYRVIKNIGTDICDHFRKSNEITVKAFQDKIAIFKKQVSMGRILVAIILFLSFLSFFNMIASEWLVTLPNSTYVTIPLMVISAIFLLTVFFFVRLPFSAYGITRKGAKRAFLGGLQYAAIFCVLFLLFKWLLLHYGWLKGQTLFDPYAGTNINRYKNPALAWWVETAVYGLFVSPVQEFLARSGLQAPLQDIFPGRFKAFLAILASNLIFMTAHVFMSPAIALSIFVPGLLYGWLFYKYNNLIAPMIAHMVTGVWALNIVGWSI